MVREQAMINFLDEVEKTKKKEKDIKKFTESVDFKFKKIKEVKEDAREICLDKLISDIYKNAVPIDNDVKDVLADDLDDEFVQFFSEDAQENAKKIWSDWEKAKQEQGVYQGESGRTKDWKVANDADFTQTMVISTNLAFEKKKC